MQKIDIFWARFVYIHRQNESTLTKMLLAIYFLYKTLGKVYVHNNFTNN